MPAARGDRRLSSHRQRMMRPSGAAPKCGRPRKNEAPRPKRGRPPAAKRAGPSYQSITRNVFVSRSRIYGDSPVCQCDPDSMCGDQCINRQMQVLCRPRTCPCGARCTNISFDKRPSPPLDVVDVGERGWGLVTPAALYKGQYLGQYCGELINMEEAMHRVRQVYARSKKYYFLEYDASAGEVIDAGMRGNKLRFVNHSCDPNCYFEKWLLSGSEEDRNAEYQLGLFALRDIEAGEELTYNYGWSAFQPPRLDKNGERVSGERCLCGSPNCTGWLARMPKKRALARPAKTIEKKVVTAPKIPPPSAAHIQAREARARRRSARLTLEEPMPEASPVVRHSQRKRRAPCMVPELVVKPGSTQTDSSSPQQDVLKKPVRLSPLLSETAPSETPSLGSSESPLTPLDVSSPESEQPLTPFVLVFEPQSPINSFCEYDGPLFDASDSPEVEIVLPASPLGEPEE